MTDNKDTKDNKDKVHQFYTPEQIVMIDDCKDFLLTKLTKMDIEDFVKELQAELCIRECTEARYNRYLIERDTLKMEFIEKCHKDFEELKAIFDNKANEVRKKHINDDKAVKNNNEEEDDEGDSEDDSDDNSDEIPKIVKRKPLAKSKTQRQPAKRQVRKKQ